MKKNNMESKIRRAYSLVTPDVKDTVLSGATDDALKNRAVLPVKTRKSKVIRSVTAITAAAAMLAVSVFGAIHYVNNYVADCTVSLDVNPSIEIKVSKKERVLDVTAKNTDGMLILGDMDLKGTDIDVTVNALIGSMVKNGYISELANSVLISVEGDNKAYEAELKAKVISAVEQLFSSESLDGAILSQTVDVTNDIKKLADENGITVGKAQLISKIVEKSELYKFEELAQLSINELNLISENTGGLNNVETKGNASDKSYIGDEKAIEAALKHAEVTRDQVKKLKSEFDYEDGMMVYEVEFDLDSKEYEYAIDAVTGEVLDVEIDNAGKDDHKHDHKPKKDEHGNISKERAKEIVLVHAGIGIEGVQKFNIELENDDGVKKYEIEFEANGNEYEYEINATTGTIIKFETDKKNVQDVTVPVIGENAAKAKALEHAGIDASKAVFEKVELENDDGRVSYEVEFKVGNIEYEYDIDAYTGEIIEFEKK